MLKAFPPNTLYYLLSSPAPLSQGLCITSSILGLLRGRKKEIDSEDGRSCKNLNGPVPRPAIS